MAIYQSKFLQPYNTTIDATAINPFSFTCQGSTITKYNAKVYRVSDNVQVYTTGDVTLSPVKYNNDIITFNVPANTMTNGIQYKWDVTTFENLTSATSFQVVFTANSLASITMSIVSPITSQSYTFTGTYTQTQGVPLQYFYFVFNSGTEEILRTDLTFSGNITYKFSGFVSGNNYTVQIFGVTANGASVQSAIYGFNVLYSKPNINIQPTLNQSSQTGLVDVIWGQAVQINGSVQGMGSYSYLQDFGVANNWALRLPSSAFTNYYEGIVDIPLDMSVVIPIYGFNLVTASSGTIVSLVNGSVYDVGWDDSLDRFYYNIDGIYGYSPTITPLSSPFTLVLNPTTAYVKINGVTHQMVTN